MKIKLFNKMEGKVRPKAVAAVATTLFVLLTLFAISPTGRNGLSAWADGLLTVIDGIKKDEVFRSDMDKNVGSERKANVLFYLDTSMLMNCTADGYSPNVTRKTNGNVDWARTLSDWGLTEQQVINSVKDFTFGTGSLPHVRANKDLIQNYSAGRERDSTNNMTTADTNPNSEQNKYRYYSPFEGARGQELYDVLNATSQRVPDNAGSYTGTSLYKNDMGAPGAAGYPYAMIFKNPAHWKTPPSSFTADDLMPNDSRMYKMKIVMWRLLEDTSLFDHIRFGMMTAYQDNAWVDKGYFTYDYQVSPYGKKNAYVHGTLSKYNTGESSYSNAQTATWGVYEAIYQGGNQDAEDINFAKRAYLRVPIDEYDRKWIKGGRTITHADKLRMWIDGLEDITQGNDQFYFYKQPELKTDLESEVARCIFPDPSGKNRDWYINRDGITFGYKDQNNSTKKTGNVESLSFKSGSGEAVGSALDFFSPPVFNTTFNQSVGGGKKVADLMDNVSYPIKDRCEPNWLIIFTAGSYKSGYKPSAAVENLYNHTRDNKVTLFKGRDAQGKAILEEVKLDKPIRTVVVGFVSPTSTNPKAVALRNELTLMATKGDPTNTNAKPYFANNVPELINALRNILVMINADLQDAGTKLTESKPLTDQPDGFNIFSTTYSINRNDQWKGSLTRYLTTKDSSGKITLTKKWELGSLLKNQRGTDAGSRNLVYWNGSAFAPLAYTATAETTIHPAATIFGFAPSGMDVPAGKLHPSRAFINWLYGFDYDYRTSTKTERDNMLSDFGKAKIAMVSAPSKTVPFADFFDWAETQKTNPARLYAQTNDGILHIIDPAGSSGKTVEKLALIPPPMLLPTRMASLKFTKNATGKLVWRNAAADDTEKSSEALYLLDGSLLQWYFKMGTNVNSWKSLLIGTLGRGGNGLYLMDITDPTAPKFYWYRETIDYGDGNVERVMMTSGSTPQSDGKKSFSSLAAIYAAPDNYPWYQLGFNIPQPRCGVILGSGSTPTVPKYQNVMVLAGGMMRSLDISQNGKVGAALYIVDPDVEKHTGFGAANTGGVLKVFNSGSLTNNSWRTGTGNNGTAPYMGMMTSEPTLYSTKNDWIVADKLITMDNRGNIFDVSMDVSSFDIKTIATLRPYAERSTDQSYASPYKLVLGKSGINIWAGGGTANVGTRDNTASGYNDSSLLVNAQQMFFSLNVTEAAAGNGTLYRGVMQNLTAQPDSIAPTSAKAWYLLLNPVDATYSQEYVSAQPVLMGGNSLVFATYRQKLIDNTSASDCATFKRDGKSRLFFVDMVSGGPTQWAKDSNGKSQKKFIEINGIKITDLSVSTKGGKTTLLIGYTELDENAAQASLNTLMGGDAKGLRKVTNGVLEVSDTPAGSGSVKPDNGSSIVYTWTKTK